ncbi:MAG: DUF4384 domain-containing protein [Candidatus Melainabacteria bacterium]|nr:DUF4384 domain-containing protein [Candidatus Melainabacteria bacterium]
MKASHGLMFLLVGFAFSLSLQGSLADEDSLNSGKQPTDTTRQDTPMPVGPSVQTRGFYFEPTSTIRQPVIPKVVGSKRIIPKPQASGQPLHVPKTGSAVSTKTKSPSQTATISVPQNIDPALDSTMLPVAHQGLSAGGPIVVVAKLNKGGALPKYKVGEKMEISVSAAQDCNILVFNYDSKNTLIQIFPNDYQQDSFLKAGSSVVIGGTDSPFDYEIAGSGGAEKIFVYAYPAAAANPISVAFNPIPHTPFRSASLNTSQYQNLVNSSKVFFTREIKVVPKSGAKLASATSMPTSPNKIELSFIVESK